MDENYYIEELKQLEQDHSLRRLPGEIPEGLINLSSNDYLGISNDKELLDEFIDTCKVCQLKFSAASSRLLTGDSSEYSTLENKISLAFNREACLIYNSGYHANTGILPAISGKDDLIVADKLVHASIIDGLQLSKAEVQRYRHLDYNHLEKILQKSNGRYKNVFIVSESIFSMDGDMADLPRLVEIKKRYNTYLYIDEAHAVGVRGKNGLGCAEESGCINECDFIVGTFGKAIASLGAYVVCSDVFKQFLVNRSRTLIYTTALPPVNLAWTSFIFDKLPEFESKRERLTKLSSRLAKLLGVSSSTHIVPFVTGSNKSAIELSIKLRKEGFYVLPIRYPTVPKGKERLRFSLNASITMEMLNEISAIINANISTSSA